MSFATILAPIEADGPARAPFQAALRLARRFGAIVIAKGMALGLSFKWRASPVFAALAELLGDATDHLTRLLPPVPGRGALADVPSDRQLAHARQLLVSHRNLPG